MTAPRARDSRHQLDNVVHSLRSAGKPASRDAAASLSTVACVSSNVTTATLLARSTATDFTPGTLESASRTATTQVAQTRFLIESVAVTSAAGAVDGNASRANRIASRRIEHTSLMRGASPTTRPIRQRSARPSQPTGPPWSGVVIWAFRTLARNRPFGCDGPTRSRPRR